ncbi:MAG: hypothetical protein EBU00_09690 [Alphaproteobacteria bacterium]|nr:hypothetical protein [Alphaproteobacteria bacterium]
MGLPFLFHASFRRQALRATRIFKSKERLETREERRRRQGKRRGISYPKTRAFLSATGRSTAIEGAYLKAKLKKGKGIAVWQPGLNVSPKPPSPE